MLRLEVGCTQGRLSRVLNMSLLLQQQTSKQAAAERDTEKGSRPETDLNSCVAGRGRCCKAGAKFMQQGIGPSTGPAPVKALLLLNGDDEGSRFALPLSFTSLSRRPDMWCCNSRPDSCCLPSSMELAGQSLEGCSPGR